MRLDSSDIDFVCCPVRGNGLLHKEFWQLHTFKLHTQLTAPAFWNWAGVLWRTRTIRREIVYRARHGEP